MKIFVIGLPYDLDDAELEEIFEKFGTVASAKVAIDRETGKSRGFGFVEMPNSVEAKDAIENLNDICASIQHTIIEILMRKLKSASEQTGINEIAIAGGVSANSGLRYALLNNKFGWHVFIPKFEYCTDNAAMIAITGYLKYLKNDFAGEKSTASPRLKINR